jgi:hypothetical protein
MTIIGVSRKQVNNKASDDAHEKDRLADNQLGVVEPWVGKRGGGMPLMGWAGEVPPLNGFRPKVAWTGAA